MLLDRTSVSSYYKILLAEDDQYITDIVKTSVYNTYGNVQLYSTDTVAEAFKLFNKIDFDIILVDYKLTNGTTLEFVRIAKQKKSILPIIVISSFMDLEIKMDLLAAGATVFIDKPFTIPEILAVLKNLLALNETYRGLEHAENIIEALTRAIELRDPYTEGHAKRVSEIAVRIFDAVGLKGEQRRDLYVGCLLHDIGKIGIPDAILKEGKTLQRNSAEFELLKTHPQAGYDICKDIHQLKPALPVILQHHERMDGSGYPNGLYGRDINILAQIAAIADIYDALTSKRTYREAKTPKEAIEIMEKEEDKINSFFFNVLKTRVITI